MWVELPSGDPEAHRTRLNPGRDESGPFLAAKRDVLFTVVRSTDKVPPDVVHVTLVLHEKKRSHLGHETRAYVILGPTYFAKFIVI